MRHMGQSVLVQPELLYPKLRVSFYAVAHQLSLPHVFAAL